LADTKKCYTVQLQPILVSENIVLEPLQSSDFEALFTVASDPLIWEQHPNKERYKREVFEVFFEGAITSKGAFKILDKNDKAVMGSTRFYDYNETDQSIFIGYTFYGRKYWGSKCNPEVKRLMLNYAFQYIEKVFFHVGGSNIRSQKAMEKLGAIKVREIEVAYHGEPEKLNFEYSIDKKDWK
jgi:RimJ/RimL family protein N-acetyltransferase